MVGLGDNFESANAAVMYHARSFVTAAETMNGEQQKELEAMKTDNEVTKVWAENWHDGLTYCKFSPKPNPAIITDSRKAPGMHSGRILQRRKF